MGVQTLHVSECGGWALEGSHGQNAHEPWAYNDDEHQWNDLTDGTPHGSRAHGYQHMLVPPGG